MQSLIFREVKKLVSPFRSTVIFLFQMHDVKKECPGKSVLKRKRASTQRTGRKVARNAFDGAALALALASTRAGVRSLFSEPALWPTFVGNNVATPQVVVQKCLLVF